MSDSSAAVRSLREFQNYEAGHHQQRPRTRAYVKSLALLSTGTPSDTVSRNPPLSAKKVGSKDRDSAPLKKKPLITTSKAKEGRVRSQPPSKPKATQNSSGRTQVPKNQRNPGKASRSIVASKTVAVDQSTFRRSARIASIRNRESKLVRPNRAFEVAVRPTLAVKGNRTKRQTRTGIESDSRSKRTADAAGTTKSRTLLPGPKSSTQTKSKPQGKRQVGQTKASHPFNHRGENRIVNQPESTVTDWLNHLPAIRTPSPTELHHLSFNPMPRRIENPQGESSSSVTNGSKSSSIAPDDIRSCRSGNTLKGNTKAFTDDFILQRHYIEIESSTDPSLAEFDLLERLKTPKRRLSLSTYKKLVEVFEEKTEALKRLLPTSSDGIRFSETEAFSIFDSTLEDLYLWRPPDTQFRFWPGITDHSFRLDQSHCTVTNEAYFQRTSMMSIVDRHDFQGYFSSSCEELWSTGEHRMPSTVKGTSKIPAPKPDLMICFQGKAIEPSYIKRTKVPDFLGPCLYPCSGRNLTKMFPFLFIEVKKGDSSLKGGFERNLNSASQALYNIHQLARHYPDLEKLFFRQIRVFTLDANVSHMNLRIHRAEYLDSTSRILTYKYFEFDGLKNYDRDGACHFVKTVLLGYGLPKLLPFFRRVFRRISEQPPPSQFSSESGRGEKRKQFNEAEDVGTEDDYEDGTQADLRTGSAGNTTSQGGPGGSSVGDGSQTPRTQRSPTQLTGSFRSGIALEEQPSPKRKKKVNMTVS